MHCSLLPLVLVMAGSAGSAPGERLEPAAQFVRSLWFEEESCTMQIGPDVRIHVNVPLGNEPGVRTRVLVYALPNGNTIEQTLGCRMTTELDWRYDIQHVAAQVRLLRAIDASERLILVCAEAGGLSWPEWRRSQSNADARIVALTDQWRRRFGGPDARVTLAGHSGGGSFMFALVEGAAEIPAWIDRIAFLDANYAFDGARHASRLERWLAGDDARRLVVVAYDDREIMLGGRKVVGPQGGTWRATGRMRTALESRFTLAESVRHPFIEYSGLDGRVRCYVHPNHDNKILHTALVGEMNGLVHAQALGTLAEGAWGTFGGPRAFAAWIQPAPAGAEPALAGQTDPESRAGSFPERPADAAGGLAVMRRVEPMSLAERETVIAREITSGNFPQFLRRFKQVPLSGQGSDGEPMAAVMKVMCDYLAVGSDTDFVRVPLTPQTAQRIADQFGCVLPTRKMVDAIDRHAEVHLEPRPLTMDRESVATFIQHHAIIEAQRAGRELGALVIGIKKDVVLSPRIFERPDRLAIYGWRKLDGVPIQNLKIVHVNRYVDYSHGIRLVRNTVEIDGQSVKLLDLLRDPDRCHLVSDEGPMDPPRY